MSDTDHQSELNEVKAKAFRILEHHGVRSALQTVLDSNDFSVMRIFSIR